MQSSERTSKISLGEKIGYGLGDTAFNFYWTGISAFLLYFYTDVFLLPAAAIGILMVSVKVINAFTDAALGAMADRTRTRYGKFRPYLIVGAVPLAVAGVLLYSAPNFSAQGKLVWMFCTYLLMMTCYTFMSIPYSALSGVITANPRDRDSINSARFVGGYLGAALVTWGTQKMVSFFGQGNEIYGWQCVMIFWGIAASVLFAITFFSTKERIEPVSSTQPRVLEDLSDLISNIPWLAVFAVNLMVMILLTLRTSTTVYYFKYYVGKPEFSAQFLPIFMMAAVCGAFSAPFFTRYFEKKTLLFFLVFFMGVFSACFYFVPPNALGVMLFLQIAIGFCLGMKPPITFSMLADVADFNEWKHGRRATAMTFAAGVFSQKLGSVLATISMTSVFAWMGYKANEVQSAESLHGIILLMSVIPAIFAFFAACGLIFYSLNKKTMEEIQQDLAQRALNKIDH